MFDPEEGGRPGPYAVYKMWLKEVDLDAIAVVQSIETNQNAKSDREDSKDVQVVGVTEVPLTSS